MTSRADAMRAARVFRATQPDIDELKDTIAANKAAREILGSYMLEKHLSVFGGVTLRCVPFSGWDGDKLTVFLGKRLKQFRKVSQRKHFDLVKRGTG